MVRIMNLLIVVDVNYSVFEIQIFKKILAACTRVDFFYFE